MNLESPEANTKGFQGFFFSLSLLLLNPGVNVTGVDELVNGVTIDDVISRWCYLPEPRLFVNSA